MVIDFEIEFSKYMIKKYFNLTISEGLDSGRRLSDLSVSQGYTRRTKEIMQWAKKRRRFIR
jgi:hypothetical protein